MYVYIYTYMCVLSCQGPSYFATLFATFEEHLRWAIIKPSLLGKLGLRLGDRVFRESYVHYRELRGFAGRDREEHMRRRVILVTGFAA